MLWEWQLIDLCLSYVLVFESWYMHTGAFAFLFVVVNTSYHPFCPPLWKALLGIAQPGQVVAQVAPYALPQLCHQYQPTAKIILMSLASVSWPILETHACIHIYIYMGIYNYIHLFWAIRTYNMETSSEFTLKSSAINDPPILHHRWASWRRDVSLWSNLSRSTACWPLIKLWPSPSYHNCSQIFQYIHVSLIQCIINPY